MNARGQGESSSSPESSSYPIPPLRSFRFLNHSAPFLVDFRVDTLGVVQATEIDSLVALGEDPNISQYPDMQLFYTAGAIKFLNDDYMLWVDYSGQASTSLHVGEYTNVVSNEDSVTALTQTDSKALQAMLLLQARSEWIGKEEWLRIASNSINELVEDAAVLQEEYPFSQNKLNVLHLASQLDHYPQGHPYNQYSQYLEQIYEKYDTLVSVMDVFYPEEKKAVVEAFEKQSANGVLETLKFINTEWKKRLALVQKAKERLGNFDATWINYGDLSDNEVFLLFPMLYSTGIVSKENLAHFIGALAAAIGEGPDYQDSVALTAQVKVFQEQTIPVFILWYISQYGFYEGNKFAIDFVNSMGKSRTPNRKPSYYWKRQYMLFVKSVQFTVEQGGASPQNPDFQVTDPVFNMVKYYGQLYRLVENRYTGRLELQLKIPVEYYQSVGVWANYLQQAMSSYTA
ncbi:hypothetical protein IWQ62_001052 [Dispira parvispora]|uniref:Uncharacterized protein n=1 Tax=Dispira parvispora TaxID=1520584 RepID=A0A9W8E8L7_9FUNG|nr:hypothetical protein IWQ62_001052 [Dispira parvispora]